MCHVESIRRGSSKEQRHAVPPDIQAEAAEEEASTLNHLIAPLTAELGAHVDHPSAEGEEAAHTSAQTVTLAYLLQETHQQAKGSRR